MIATAPRSLAPILACLLLAACAGRVEPPAGTPAPVPPPPPSQPQPNTPSRPLITPAPGQPAASTANRCSHPRYAPPPGSRSCWDNGLGVYRVEGKALFYRQRLFYRWDGEWYSAGTADGPWEPTSPPSVPPGLRKLHAQ